MELATESDIYCPNIDNTGTYVDKIPNFKLTNNGVRCPCGTRKDKIYSTRAIFLAHIKTKNHQKWLDEVNANRANYFVENQNLKEIISQQRLIIAQFEKDLSTRAFTVDYLTNELHRLNIMKKNEDTNDLLNFD